MAVYAVGRVSGAHLNPAVTIALASIGSSPWAEVPGYIGAQMVGAIARRRAGLADVPPPLGRHRGSRREARRRSATGPAIRHRSNLIGEIIGTAVLVFGILAIAANAQTLSKPGDVDLSFVFSRGLQPLLVGVLVLGDRPFARRPHGLRDQSRARPGAAHRPRDPADRRQGILGLGVKPDPVIAPIIGGIAGAGLYSLVGF